MGRSVRVKEMRSPCCGRTLSGCCDPDGLNSPNAGDLTVCIYCGDILQFDSALGVKRPDPEAIVSLQLFQPEDFARLLEIQAVARTLATNPSIKTTESLLLRPENGDPPLKWVKT